MDDFPLPAVAGQGRTLALGVALAHGLPAGVLMAFAATAPLAPPFDALPVGDPLAIAWVALGAIATGLLARATLHDTARRLAVAGDGAAFELLRARVRSCSRRMPGVTAIYVAGGLGLLGVLAPAPDLDGGALVALGALALLLVGQMLAPALLVAYDAFGACFGAVVRDRPALPSALRGAPMILLALVLALVLPLADLARFGTLAPGTPVLVAGLVAYAALVIVISLHFTRQALSPVADFLASAEAGHPDDGLLTPRALDDVGVAVARTRELVRSLERARRDLERSEARLTAFAGASSDWYF